MSDPFERIYRLSRLGEIDAALAQLLDESGMRLMPPFDEDPNHGWYVAGDFYYRKGDFEAAARAFEKSIADRPDDHEALIALANCYFELGMPILSEKYLRAAKRYSDDAVVIYNLGNALFDQGKYDEAIEIYKEIASESGEIFDLAQKNMRTAEAKMVNEDN